VHLAVLRAQGQQEYENLSAESLYGSYLARANSRRDHDAKTFILSPKRPVLVSDLLIATTSSVLDMFTSATELRVEDHQLVDVPRG
jgi:hypothetical protein